VPSAAVSSNIPLAGGKTGHFTVTSVKTQEDALLAMAEMTLEDTANPIVRNAAIAIVEECEARHDECELAAIFEAVKHGTDKVKGLSRGLKYVSDPRHRDFYVAPHRLLQLCASGSCGGDCDDHAMLCAALAGALGFRVGLRAWGEKKERGYSHVYAVALLPKDGEAGEKSKVFGLDTSADVGDSTPGWEPPEGRVLTAWLEEEDD
jgi:hypothetical protein